jgi:hypothetical protein
MALVNHLLGRERWSHASRYEFPYSFGAVFEVDYVSLYVAKETQLKTLGIVHTQRRKTLSWDATYQCV